MNTDTQNFQTENNPALNLQGIATSLRAKKRRSTRGGSHSNISILCDQIHINIWP
ncbi:hypothetical protein [Lactobacillus sp.]|uniref:hypothetical protein n=1 Tax=Lactobacillus sp. TaxID=1591 RepID=UPI003F08919B